MEKIYNIITILEKEKEIQRELQYDSCNEHIIDWTKGYCKGIDFACKVLKCVFNLK